MRIVDDSILPSFCEIICSVHPNASGNRWKCGCIASGAVSFPGDKVGPPGSGGLLSVGKKVTSSSAFFQASMWIVFDTLNDCIDTDWFNT